MDSFWIVKLRQQFAAALACTLFLLLRFLWPFIFCDICSMLNEVFQITVNGADYHIVTALPVGPNSVDHEVWNSDELVFVINPRLDKCDQPCWALAAGYTNHKIDKTLVQQIDEAIERHYL